MGQKVKWVKTLNRAAADALPLTPNFSWVESGMVLHSNRFNGFPQRPQSRPGRALGLESKTAEAVKGAPRLPYTQLKLGVNESALTAAGIGPRSTSRFRRKSGRTFSPLRAREPRTIGSPFSANTTSSTVWRLPTCRTAKPTSRWTMRPRASWI